MSFNEFGLKDELLQAVEDLGYVTPTPVQLEAIPVLISGDTDFVGLAQTGTGKTAAFGLPLLQLVDFDDRNIQGLVLCPTRELCLQITDDLLGYAKHFKRAFIEPVYGGSSISNQIKQLRRGAHIVVATPGRLIDLLERRALSLDNLRYVVLDEADEMLNMGFQEDIDRIFEFASAEKKTWLFSATMPNQVARIASNYMTNPVEITCGRKNTNATNIEHVYFTVRNDTRYLALKRIIDFNPDIYGLVFCRTRRETQEVAEFLGKDGYSAEALHGDLSQAQRDSTMRKFRDKTLQLLVATDVAARGIDVDNITHVIHYNLPDDPEQYTHRSGRTARAGRSGVSMALVTSSEMRKLRFIEQLTTMKFKQEKVPTGEEVCDKQLLSLVDKMRKTDVDPKAITRFMPSILASLEDLSREDIIARFVSSEFNRFFDYYKNAADLNAAVRERERSEFRDRDRRGDRGDRNRGDRDGVRGGSRFGDRGDRFERSDRNDRGDRNDRNDRFERSERRERSDVAMKNIVISRGERDRVNKGAIVRLICDSAGLNKRQIGEIVVDSDSTSVEVEEMFAAFTLQALKEARLDGKKFKAEIDETVKKKRGSFTPASN